jgi:hypothetical protein
MIRMMSTASSAVALPETARWNTSRESSLDHQLKVHDTLSIPTRGIFWGTLMSSCLWAVLIVGGRALWLYLR